MRIPVAVEMATTSVQVLSWSGQDTGHLGDCGQDNFGESHFAHFSRTKSTVATVPRDAPINHSNQLSKGMHGFVMRSLGKTSHLSTSMCHFSLLLSSRMHTFAMQK